MWYFAPRNHIFAASRLDKRVPISTFVTEQPSPRFGSTLPEGG